jgi:hypothetical protein
MKPSVNGKPKKEIDYGAMIDPLTGEQSLRLAAIALCSVEATPENINRFFQLLDDETHFEMICVCEDLAFREGKRNVM